MWELKKIAKVLKYIILKSDERLDNKPTIIFFGMDSYQKRDLHSEAKRAGFKPVYSMKQPSIKHLLQGLSSWKIENDMFKTMTIDIEHFGILIDIFYKNDLLISEELREPLRVNK